MNDGNNNWKKKLILFGNELKKLGGESHNALPTTKCMQQFSELSSKQQNVIDTTAHRKGVKTMNIFCVGYYRWK
jgi:hypothetical protein